MFSNIRKTFGYLVMLEVVMLCVAALMVTPPSVEPDSTPDPLFGALLLGWLLLSFVHAIFTTAGKPERVTALCGLFMGGWLFYHEWVAAADPSYTPTMTIADWQVWVFLGALLIPPIDQLLDLFLPPWPWSKKD